MGNYATQRGNQMASGPANTGPETGTVSGLLRSRRGGLDPYAVARQATVYGSTTPRLDLVRAQQSQVNTPNYDVANRGDVTTRKAAPLSVQAPTGPTAAELKAQADAKAKADAEAAAAKQAADAQAAQQAAIAAQQAQFWANYEAAQRMRGGG